MGNWNPFSVASCDGEKTENPLIILILLALTVTVTVAQSSWSSNGVCRRKSQLSRSPTNRSPDKRDKNQGKTCGAVLFQGRFYSKRMGKARDGLWLSSELTPSLHSVHWLSESGVSASLSLTVTVDWVCLTPITVSLSVIDSDSGTKFLLTDMSDAWVTHTDLSHADTHSVRWLTQSPSWLTDWVTHCSVMSDSVSHTHTWHSGTGVASVTHWLWVWVWLTHSHSMTHSHSPSLSSATKWLI